MKTNKGIHLGIIPDGSRRWAKIKGIKSYDGRQSAAVMEKLLNHVFENHPEVSEISIWVLSTENLSRSAKDKKLIFELLKLKMKNLLYDIRMYHKSVKVNIVGSRWGEMPREMMELAQTIVSETIDREGPVLNMCMGYGGKEEILNAIKGVSRWLRENPWEKNLCKNVFEQFLLVPKPLDMVIRTGGEMRLSGFMLYQIEYAELFFTDTLWPEFTTIELDKMLEEFSKRCRRFGR